MSSNPSLLYVYKSSSPSSSRLSPTRCLIGLRADYLKMLWRSTRSTWSPPVTSTSWCPWPQYHACCHPCSSWWSELHEGPLTTFQLISSPSSSLTHDNLVSKPPGEDAQRKCFPLEQTNGFFLVLLLLLEQVSFILCLPAGDIFIPYLKCRPILLPGPYLRVEQGVNVQETNRSSNSTVNLGPIWLRSFPHETHT